jgi:hypothetical protein
MFHVEHSYFNYCIINDKIRNAQVIVREINVT